MNKPAESKYTDQQLIEGIKNKDRTVITEFVREYQNRIFRLCMQYMRSEDEALDMVQEVFATILEKITAFRQESKLSTWIYSITVFTCIGYLRKKKKKNETSYDENPHNNQSDSDYLLGKYSHLDLTDARPLEDDLLKKEAREVLMKEVHALPNDYKTIFILKELEGLSIKEIQNTVPISISAIKTRLHRARIYLRNKLVEYFTEMKAVDDPA